MTRYLLGDWIADSARLPFAPEHPGSAMHYAGLGCACGAGVFRLHGWPHSLVGRGGYFWRSLVRVWREARLPMTGEEPGRSPFLLPIFVDCEHCDRSAPLFDEPGLSERIDSEARSLPHESYRCRACRRGRVSLVIGWTELPDELRGRGESDDPEGTGSGTGLQTVAMAGRAFELVAGCRACQRQVRIVVGDARARLQEARLDLLYGRR